MLYGFLTLASSKRISWVTGHTTKTLAGPCNITWRLTNTALRPTVLRIAKGTTRRLLASLYDLLLEGLLLQVAHVGLPQLVQEGLTVLHRQQHPTAGL